MIKYEKSRVLPRDFFLTHELLSTPLFEWEQS